MFIKFIFLTKFIYILINKQNSKQKNLILIFETIFVFNEKVEIGLLKTSSLNYEQINIQNIQDK